MSDTRSSRAGKARIGALGFTAIAIVLSLLSAILIYNLLSQQGYDQEAMQPIVVAAEPLAAGEPINAQNLLLKPWPMQSVPDGAFASIEGLLKQKNKVPLHTILKGEAVVSARLSSSKAGSGMAPLIPNEMRGFAVRADRWLTDAEMLYPGAVIDIVSSGKVKVSDVDGRSQKELTVSKIILQKIKVVAVNGAVDAVRFGGGPNGEQRQQAARGSRAVITLLVSPEQAEILALAKGKHKLDFILRNSSDESISETVGSSDHDVYDVGALQVKRVEDSMKSLKEMATLMEGMNESGSAKPRRTSRPRATMRRRSSGRSSTVRKKRRSRAAGELRIGD